MEWISIEIMSRSPVNSSNDEHFMSSIKTKHKKNCLIKH